MPIYRPSMYELIDAVREFLQEKVMPAVDKHTAFHTRVAVNVLNTVQRELAEGTRLDTEEHERLRQLLKQDGNLKQLNDDLCRKIQEGEIDLGNGQLIDHLYQTVLGRLSIDNPRYSTYRKAFE